MPARRSFTAGSKSVRYTTSASAPTPGARGFKSTLKRGYANLVREDSVFWNASGVDINFGLLHGLEINIESLRSLAIGGVAFATPGASRPPAKATARFRLYEKPESEWLEWAPEIPIAPGPEAS